MAISFRSSVILTGIAAIDDLHRDVTLTLAHLGHLSSREFGPGFGVLVDKLERAFSAEDIWMEETAYPGLHQHRERHAKALSGLRQVQARLAEGDLELGRDIAGELLPEWLELHMATMDIPMAAWIRVAGLEEDQPTSP